MRRIKARAKRPQSLLPATGLLCQVQLWSNFCWLPSSSAFYVRQSCNSSRSSISSSNKVHLSYIAKLSEQRDVTLQLVRPLSLANRSAAIPDSRTRLEAISWIRGEFERNRRIHDVVSREWTFLDVH